MKDRLRGRGASVGGIATAAVVLVATLAFPMIATALPGGALDRVSVTSAGAQATGGDSDYTAVSDNGRFVAFESKANNLVPGDTNGYNDVFLRDRLLGTTVRVSVTHTGVQSLGADHYLSNISPDGRFVTFYTATTDIVQFDLNSFADVFMYDALTGSVERVSVGTGGTQAIGGRSEGSSISSGGRYVVFDSEASNLATDDANGKADVYLRDRVANTTTRISRTSTGASPSGWSYQSQITPDGRYVVFRADNNLVPSDTDAFADIYVKDTKTGALTLCSQGLGIIGNNNSYAPAISADGRYVAFDSTNSSLVLGDTNSAADVFVYDTKTGVTKRVDVSTAGVQSNGTHSDDSPPKVSANGRYVVFGSDATNLVDGDSNGAWDVFIHDNVTGVTQRVSVTATGVQGAIGNALNPSVSGDGSVVAFANDAANLVGGDNNGYSDILVKSGVTPLIVTKASVARTPAGAKTYKRKKGKAVFTLGATVTDIGGAAVSGLKVQLQSSANGKTKWGKVYTATSPASGHVSKKFTVKKKKTRYYRWVVIGNAAYTGTKTSAQRIRVK